MKKKILMGILVVVICWYNNIAMAQSIDPISLIISKAIKVIDLKVQRLQNETLVRQQVQISAEQELSKNKLSEITGWQQQLSTLYAGYFSELKQVKSTISGGSMVKRILALQQQVVIEYGRMGKEAGIKPPYDALLNTSMDILQTLQLTLTSQLSMKDAERINVLQNLKDAMYQCLQSMQLLNRQQLKIISKRTRLQANLQFVKRLHGIQ